MTLNYPQTATFRISPLDPVPDGQDGLHRVKITSGKKWDNIKNPASF